MAIRVAALRYFSDALNDVICHHFIHCFHLKRALTPVTQTQMAKSKTVPTICTFVRRLDVSQLNY